MTNKAPGPQMAAAAAGETATDRQPALPKTSPIPTPSPDSTVVSYDPLPHEKHLFESLFKVALLKTEKFSAGSDSPDGGPVELKRLPLEAAKVFLLRSGLSEKNIDVILTTAAPSPKDSTKKRTTISRSRFYVAVRLVQLRQQSVKVTNLDLNKMTTPKGKPLEPPYFDGLGEESRSSRPRAAAKREQNTGMKLSKSSTDLQLDKQRRRSSTDAVAPARLSRSISDKGQRKVTSSSLTSIGDKPRELRSCLRNAPASNKHSSKSLGTLTTTSASTSASSLVNDDETVRCINSTVDHSSKTLSYHNDKCCACCKTSRDKAAALEAELVSARKLIKSLYEEMDTIRMNTERAISRSTLQVQGQNHRHGSHRHEHHHRQRSAPPTQPSTRAPRASITEHCQSREDMRGSINVHSGSRRASTNEDNASRSRPSGSTRDYYGNYSEYSHSRSNNNHDVYLTVPMSYRIEDFNAPQEFDESLNIATDLQQLHSAAAFSKTLEDQQKSTGKRSGMLNRMKQSIRAKKGDQMGDFNADTSGYTEPDTSWQRLSQKASSSSVGQHSNYNLSSSLRHKRPPVA